LALLAWTRVALPAAPPLLVEAQRYLSNIDSAEPVAFAQLVAGMVAFRRGDLANACERIGGAVRLFETVDDAAIWYAGWECIALLAAGRTAEANDAIGRQERRIAALPAAALPARSGRNFLALAYLMRGDDTAARGCEAALADFPDDFHWTPVRRTLVAIAASRGDTKLALALLDIAERQAREQDLLPEVALTLLARADLLSASEPLRERCRRDAEAIVARLGIAFPERMPRAGSAHPTSPLSEREIEVLRLVAQGQTNREIAATLVLSERTVINHLSHIFTKIDAANRAAATAYALRHGLA
jgi:ATP/maltotriose-dependent transcriptional regulator MalT